MKCLRRGLTFITFIVYFFGLLFLADASFGTFMGVIFPVPDLKSVDVPHERIDVLAPYSAVVRPPSLGTIASNSVQLNKEGLRGKDAAVEKPPGRRRILILGDSFTFNFALKDEETYPFLLEQTLNKGETNWEVLNFGVDGFNTRMELELFKEKGLKYRPDIVILQVHPNDWQGHWKSYFAPVQGWRYQHVFFLNQLAIAFNGKLRILNYLSFLSLQRFAKSRQEEEKLRLGSEGWWEKMSEPLQELIGLKEAHDFTLILFSFYPDASLGQISLGDRLQDFAEREGVSFFDLSGVYRSYHAEEMAIHPQYNTHFSPFARSEERRVGKE